MKKFLSIISLAARSTIYKIAIIISAMTSIEILLFSSILKNMDINNLIHFDKAINRAFIPITCAIAFCLISIILGLFCIDTKNSQTKYTIKRLSVNEKACTIIWSLYSMFCFFIFWAIQILTIYILSKIYYSYLNPTIFDSQTIYVSFYKDAFLHSILPLDETSRYIRNIIAIVALGLSTTCFALKHRRGKLGLSSIVFSLFVIIFFSQQMGSFSSDLFIIFISVTAILYFINYIWKGEEDEE